MYTRPGPAWLPRRLQSITARYRYQANTSILGRSQSRRQVTTSAPKATTANMPAAREENAWVGHRGAAGFDFRSESMLPTALGATLRVEIRGPDIVQTR